METSLKCFSFIKISAWLSAEFAETMFLLTGDLGIFDKAIGEDPVSHAIAQLRFNISHLNLSASMNLGLVVRIRLELFLKCRFRVCFLRCHKKF